MIRSGKPDDRNYMSDIYQISTLLYLSTYLIVRIIETTYHSVAMWWFDIPHWHRITFIHHRTYSLDYWDDYRVMVVFGFGSLLLLIIGVYQFRRLVRNKHLDWLERLMLLWLSVHLINAVVGGMISGTLVFDRLGYVMGWLYLRGTIAKLVFTIGGFLGLFFLAKTYATHFQNICINKNLLVGRIYRQEFLISIVLLPWATSTLLMALWDYLQHDYYSILQNLVLSVFCIVVVFFSSGLSLVPKKAGVQANSGIQNRQKAKRILLLFILMVLGLSMASKYLQ